MPDKRPPWVPALEATMLSPGLSHACGRPGNVTVNTDSRACCDTKTRRHSEDPFHQAELEALGPLHVPQPLHARRRPPCRLHLCQHRSRWSSRAKGKGTSKRWVVLSMVIRWKTAEPVLETASPAPKRLQGIGSAPDALHGQQRAVGCSCSPSAEGPPGVGKCPEHMPFHHCVEAARWVVGGSNYRVDLQAGGLGMLGQFPQHAG